jgi:Ser/Thr protein kinase RdoA (MazF antagonist)
MTEVIGRGRTAEIYAWGEGKVLKLYFDWCNPEWVDQEFKAAQIAQQAGVPVPVPYELLKKDGRQGIVFERISGNSLIAEFKRRPWNTGSLFRQMADLQVTCQLAPAPGLHSLKASLERQVKKAVTFGLTQPQVESILAHLDQLPDGDQLCHMDFHPDNVMITRRGLMIIDWMNALSGPPMADTARTWLLLTNGSPPPGAEWMAPFISLVRKTACTNYYHRFQQLKPFKLSELNAWMLPVAAARLAEEIQTERDSLIRIVTQLLEKVSC